MRVFGAVTFVLGASLLGYGVNVVVSSEPHWRVGELLVLLGVFLGWWGVNCLRDRRLRQ